MKNSPSCFILLEVAGVFNVSKAIFPMESLFEQAFETGGDWCFKLHALLCYGVKEAELIGMEAEPV